MSLCIIIPGQIYYRGPIDLFYVDTLDAGWIVEIFMSHIEKAEANWFAIPMITAMSFMNSCGGGLF